MEPLTLSIVIPVFNVEKYLTDCLQSVVTQTCTDFEAIVVDDGSTDQSLEICRRYERADSRIRVIHQEHQGVSSARNAGIHQARGQYLLFIDSDDVAHPNLVAWIKAHAAQGHWMLAWDRVDFFEDERPVWPNPQGEAEEVRTLHDVMESVFTDKRFAGYIWNKCFKTSVIQNRLAFHQDISHMEDALFSCQYLAACPQDGAVLSTKAALYAYRHRKSGASYMPMYKRKMSSLMAQDLMIQTVSGFVDEHRLTQMKNTLLRSVLVMAKKMVFSGRSCQMSGKKSGYAFMVSLWQKYGDDAQSRKGWRIKLRIYAFLWDLIASSRRARREARHVP